MTRLAIVLQTARDRHSSVYLTYQALAAEIERRGHSATIRTPQDFPATSAYGGRFTPLAYPIAVARWMRRARGSFDAAIFHSYAGWLAIATRGVPATVAVSFHGLEPLYHAELGDGRRLSGRYRFLQERLMPMFLRASCRGASRVTCLNAAEQKFLVDRGWVDAARVVLVAHGVPDDFFLSPRAPRPPRTLLFVAQWLPMKGIEALRTAFTELARRWPDLRLVCAGTLLAADEVQRSFAADVRSRVAVLPRVNRAALVDVYRQADIFLFPSHYEGFGLALVEAMAARLPIVTTAVGVAADALEDGRSALLVPKRDPAAIARAVERILQAPDGDRLGRTLGDAAHLVAQRFREEDCIRQWADAILSLTSGGPGAPHP
jgi:glycosyltransferase involved in cell wall biosynthesis